MSRYTELVFAKAFRPAKVDCDKAVADLKPAQVVALDFFVWHACCVQHLDVMHKLDEPWLDANFAMDPQHGSTSFFKCAACRNLSASKPRRVGCGQRHSTMLTRSVSVLV